MGIQKFKELLSCILRRKVIKDKVFENMALIFPRSRGQNMPEDQIMDVQPYQYKGRTELDEGWSGPNQIFDV
jgi:hypothetical protein